MASSSRVPGSAIAFAAALFIVAVLLQLSTSSAQPLTNEEQALLQRLKQRDNQFKPKVEPKIVTEGGDIKLMVEDGNHIGYKVGNDDEVNIDEVPEQLRGYTQATMEALALGYNMGTAGRNESDTKIDSVKTSLELQLESIKTNVNGNAKSITSLEEEHQDSEKEIESIGETLEKISACLSDNKFLSDGKCQAQYKHCDHESLKIPANGTMQGHAILPGTHMQFSCDDGFFMDGNPIVTCLPNGSFTAKEPKCKPCEDSCKVCTADVCLAFDIPGMSQENPAKSCDQIKSDFKSAPSGPYFIKVTNKIYRLYCDMDSEGGGWTLIAKANNNRGADGHLNRVDINTECLSTNNLNCAATLGTAARLALNSKRLNKFECGGWKGFAYRNCNNHGNSWWSSGCGCLCWSNSYATSKSGYSIGSAPDCGSPVCDGPSRSGRNWARRGQNGCGLVHGSYGKSGYWWVK